MHTQTFKLPRNMRATTDPVEAITGAQFALHAVPVQATRKFLQSIMHLLPATVPIISVSKGLEVRQEGGKGEKLRNRRRVRRLAIM
jgi:glycerol-3-phosphate dehydrogenase